jgi:hypothetical protein
MDPAVPPVAARGNGIPTDCGIDQLAHTHVLNATNAAVGIDASSGAARLF